jgi:hypothetical protein
MSCTFLLLTFLVLVHTKVPRARCCPAIFPLGKNRLLSAPHTVLSTTPYIPRPVPSVFHVERPEERKEGAVRVARGASFQRMFINDTFPDWQTWTNAWVWGIWSSHALCVVTDPSRYRLCHVRSLGPCLVDPQGSWIYQLDRPALDGVDLYRGIDPRGHGRMVQ